MQTKNLAYNLIIVALVLLALIYGKELIMPFVIALVIWYLINSVKRLIANIKIFGRTLPWPVQLAVAAGLLLSIVFFFSSLIRSSVQQFTEQYPKYHDKVIDLSKDVTDGLSLPVSLDETLSKVDIPAVMSELLNVSVNTVSVLTLVTIYVLFIMAEERIFPKKIEAMFPSREKYHTFRTTMAEIDSSIRSYVGIKTLLCLASAVSCYIVLYFTGVDFAGLWAILIFFLNYIPIIAVVGPIFPALIALLQFEGYTQAIIVISCLGTIQLIIGNLLEPKVLGDRLNLSPLVVIISLAFWGTIWGIAGMFLCIPLTVIMMIIFSQFEKTKGIAILLSGGRNL